VDASSSRFADVFVATLAGRLDHTNAEELQSVLGPLVGHQDGLLKGLVLDFRQVEYISSAGLRILMLLSRQARLDQWRIAVATPQPSVAEIFAISRFNLVVEMFPSVREALAQISPSALSAFDAAQRPASA